MGTASDPPASGRGGMAEGQTVAGKYLLGRQLGAGGMCIVYEAQHLALQQAVALKVLKPELANDADCVARFEREARAAAQLRSPNVAKVFDVDLVSQGPYITMELLVGRDIGAELAELGRLPIPLAVDYVRQALSGISEAHALGIIHRDLKPENLFLTDLGALTDRKLVKILDFGIAKNVAETARRLTAPDTVFGTVDYMSPEQIRSASAVDHRSDLWALGIILYELLTGRTPFSGDARSVIAQIVSDPVPTPSDHAPELPPSLVETVMRALEKDPARRFQSADEFRHQLEGYGDFEPITSLIARLPPQSVPRGQVRSVPPPSEQARDGRDARTHGSWETKRVERPRSKAWIILPLVGLVGGAIGATVYVSGGRVPASWRATAAGASATAPSSSAPSEAAPATEPAAEPAAMPSTTAEPPVASVEPASSAPPRSKPGKARPASPARPAPASRPPASATPTALPKRL
ncbi:MAG: serine/threonine protein kinase [Labilithrix sp.]|nr:serine/threonine protein kinase [Labilithrix sp.]